MDGVVGGTAEKERSVPSAVTGVDADAQLIGEVVATKSSQRKNKRRKKNNQIGVYMPTEEEQTPKFEDVERAQTIGVGESGGSMDVIGISLSSKEDGETVKINDSNGDRFAVLARPVVDVVMEGEHPDIVNLLKPKEEQVDAGENIKTPEVCDELVEERNNSVLKKLLRGARYFDNLERETQMCRNCGEEGHLIVNCTLKKRKKPCFVCAGFGHNGIRCPKKKALVCFYCKGTGHLSKKCPYRNDEWYSITHICLRCGDSGHDMWTCNNDYPQDDLKEIQCHICQNFGHLCCVDYPDLVSSRQVSCCNCGHSGHLGSECTIVVEQPSKNKYPVSCRKCGATDHRARRCKKRAKLKAEKAAGAERAKRAAEAKKAAQAERATQAEKAAQAKRAAQAERATQAKRVAQAERATRAERAAQAERACRDAIEARDSLGSRSAPHNLITPQQKINTSYEVRSSTTVFQPRSRHEPNNGGQRNIRFRAPGSNVWRVPPQNNMSPAYFSPDFVNPHNPFQMLNHLRYNHETPPSSSGVYSNPQNPTQIFNHLSSPGSLHLHPSHNFPIPPNPTSTISGFPDTRPQGYFPVSNYQDTSSLHAPRGYPISQNPVPMFNHYATPTYPPRFQPPWPGHYSAGRARNDYW